MDLLDAVLLGILEGLTELLPVSSTGHLILLGDLLGHESEAAKAFDIVIQLGAIVAVVVYFRRRLAQLIRGLWTRNAADVRLTLALLAAFVPTAIAGLALHKLVKALLFKPVPVAGALIAGGLIMIAVEHVRRRRSITGDEGLEHVSVGQGLLIGLAQCLSLWPGSSRSMTTIVAGQITGLSSKTAAEFSFLLAIPTLGAATVYDFVKNGHLILALPGGAAVLGVGLGVSFIVALLVTALFLRYVSRVGLAPFGYYRIALGAAVLIWATTPADRAALPAAPPDPSQLCVRTLTLCPKP